MPKSNSKIGQDQALSLLQELRKSFLADLPERFDQIESIILTLMKESFPDPEYNLEFEELYRHIHSLKGSAGIHDIALISHICHQFEDVLTKMNHQQNATVSLVDSFLLYVDLMRRTRELACEANADFSIIHDELENIRDKMIQGQLTALIVETSQTMASLYSSCLDSLPIDITIENDGLIALQRLIREKYDILIFSAETKTLNGTALIYALHATGGINKNIQSLMITSRQKIIFAEGFAPNIILKKNTKLFKKLQEAVKQITQTHQA